LGRVRVEREPRRERRRYEGGEVDNSSLALRIDPFVVFQFTPQ